MIREFLIYLSAFIGLFAVIYYFLSYIDREEKKQKKFTDSELPFVSILIPAYNEEATIEETIKSALGLDYPKDRIEILAIDDGSKDSTYKRALKVKDKYHRLKVFTKENKKSKADALNFGIARAKGEIIVTMDADTFAEPDALIKMIHFFMEENVMCVTPSMVINNPRTIWQRIQQIEYFLGVYLRKSFTSMRAVHVTPGAFSAYRKIFFERHGGFEVGNMTEDMEMALRIQLHDYDLECSDTSIVFTDSPRTFKELFIQRRRWYFGWMGNLWRYRKLFSKEYGDLGTIVLPTAVITITLSAVLTSYLAYSILIKVKEELEILRSLNFDITGLATVDKFLVERYFYLLFSNPLFLTFLAFFAIMVIYMMFAKKRVKKHANVSLNLFLFIFIYGLLLTFWWITAGFYYLFVGDIKWRTKDKTQSRLNIKEENR